MHSSRENDEHGTNPRHPQTMLNLLRIQNLALIDDLAWEPGEGFIAVTGETGTGKSVIVGALKLVLGERADRTLLRSGASQCTVEAVFRLPDPAALNKRLEESGLPPCESGELVIKRQFSATGANKQFVNCSPATLATLKTIGDDLVDLHGPHDHQSLLSRERQLDLLDAFADAAAQRRACHSAWKTWQQAASEHAALRDAEESSQQEIELLRFQVQEIEAADIDPAAETALEEQYQRATHGARLAEAAAQALGILSDAGDSLLNRLPDLQRAAREIERLDPAMTAPLQSLANAHAELEDLAATLRDYSESLDLDPAARQSLEERINTLEDLKRKYGGSLEAVVAHGAKAASRLASIENRSDLLAQLAAAEENATADLRAAATKLTAKRRAAAPKLAKAIARQLTDLGFKQSKFEISLEAHAPSAHGAEQADFLFMPNPGEPAKPLRLIGSSGEISRVMLAVKGALAAQDAVPLLVFDEIDANVGGEIATTVGRRMADLSHGRQVIAITHLPQVAVAAAHQFVVTKNVADGRTHSRLDPADGEHRVAEIARMLGGDTPSARQLATSMLGGSQ